MSEHLNISMSYRLYIWIFESCSLLRFGYVKISMSFILMFEYFDISMFYYLNVISERLNGFMFECLNFLCSAIRL